MQFDVGILKLAAAAAEHATARQSVVAQNIANSDTPGYKAKDITPFHQIAAQINDNRPQGRDIAMSFRTFDSARIGAESPNGNTVALDDQMVRSAEAKYQHDLALGVYRSSLNILRTSLGRSR